MYIPPEPFDINKMEVEITFPDGDKIILPFTEVSKDVLKDNDIELCPKILLYGIVRKGSLRYRLIEE